MEVLNVGGVQEALPRAIELLNKRGDLRNSRNGKVMVMPCPVTTVYNHPKERVMFWPVRDANPFFHLYESLWMLCGRNDVAPLTRYVKRMQGYSDDGTTNHGAYGHRWRSHWDPIDQLEEIIERLRKNHDDRRSVLQMWDVEADLNYSYDGKTEGKDVPCNMMATFQISARGELDLHVYCRSNDIIWGAYGANAVHFSLLLEYMANQIGVPMGKYYQISANWHAYIEVLEKMTHFDYKDTYPYMGQNGVRSISMPVYQNRHTLIHRIQELVGFADNGWFNGQFAYHQGDNAWIPMVYAVLRAHHLYSTLPAPEKYIKPIEYLNEFHANVEKNVDWIVAASQWIQRRWDAYEKKMRGQVAVEDKK